MNPRTTDALGVFSLSSSSGGEGWGEEAFPSRFMERGKIRLVRFTICEIILASFQSQSNKGQGGLIDGKSGKRPIEGTRAKGKVEGNS